VGDEESLEAFRQKLDTQLQRYLDRNGRAYEEVRCESKIKYDPCDVARESNCFNIDFIPTGNTDQELRLSRLQFSNLLSAELRLRQLPLYGTAEDRRDRLKSVLKVEQQLDLIMQALARGVEGKDAALMLISQAIPCIMHLENRVGEKLITVLLAMAADRFQKRVKSRNLSTRFANNIQHIVNTRILGTVTRPKQWKLPLSLTNDGVGKVSLSNAKTRLFMDNISELVDYTFSSPEDAELKQIWDKMLQDYNEAMKILRKRSEYTDEDIKTFQLKIDSFFTAYVELSGAGKEGVTNYIHMLGSAHLMYYMKVHRNLYKYSQQGWESLNAKVKLSFFNHTQRGGNYGAGVEESERSYLRSIFMYFQREILWISGLAEQHIMEKLNPNHT
jgi:hypothetical protein